MKEPVKNANEGPAVSLAGGRNNSELTRVNPDNKAVGVDAKNIYNLPSMKEENDKMENNQENRSKHPSARLPFAHPTLHIPGRLTLAELEALDAQNQEGGLACRYDNGIYTFPGVGGNGHVVLRELGEGFRLEYNGFRGNPCDYLNWCKERRANVEGCNHIKACLLFAEANRTIKMRASGGVQRMNPALDC